MINITAANAGHIATTDYTDFGTRATCSCGELDITCDTSREANAAIDRHAEENNLLDLR